MENQNTEKKTSRKKRLEGVVTSNKMTNAVTVKVSRKYPHPKYSKIMSTDKKFYAHSTEEIQIGDVVVIEESKPISKTIRWKVIEIKKS